MIGRMLMRLILDFDLDFRRSVGSVWFDRR